MPGAVDSNSPALWRDGKLYVLNSAGLTIISGGGNQFSLGQARAVALDHYNHTPLWIEAAWQDEDGALYAWYHYESGQTCDGKLTVPRIGALVSHDGGLSFTDLGIIIESGDPPDCSAENGYFAGGTGDFSVIPDQTHTYFYFLFGNYGGDPGSQGVAIARMAFKDRDNPTGAVWKYYAGAWNAPGLDGPVTPIFPVAASWNSATPDAFWGPSVHWNTYLHRYVVLLNHTCCAAGWPQEGIYITFNNDLGNPAGWSYPAKILDSAGWYPQVLGMEPEGTDKLAGQAARLYVGGHSDWKMAFTK